MEQAPKNSVATYRRQKGWSQQELAIRAGLHVQTVSEAERAYRGDPAEATWDALATALGVSVEALKVVPEPAPAVKAVGQ